MVGKPKWRRLREAGAATAAGPLLRGQGDGEPDDDEVRTSGPGDGDADDTTCPTCSGSGIANGMICDDCQGSGSVMKESTSGPYWVYSDDPEWEQLREASRAFSADVRKKFAGSGVAMSDGSFPIPDKDALGRAIKLAGNAKDLAKAKAHIKKRAAALGATDMVPDGWGSSKTKESTVVVHMSPELQKELDGLREQVDNIDLFQKLRESRSGNMTPTFSTPTRVKTSSGEEGYRVTLIREGKGNHEDDQWYTANAVRELCESGVAEGMQAYGDHPDSEEEELRPERSVKELVGTYHDVKYVKEGSGPARADAIFVPLTLDETHPRYGWVVTLAEAAVRSKAPQPICGISLYGLSAGDDGERPDGTYGRMVEMIRPASGDIVTNAGAGGGFVRQLMESARALRTRTTTPKEITPMEALAYQRAVREAAKRVREADSDEARTEALTALSALESESIDNAPDSVQALREAAPALVEEIEASVKAETEPTLEQLKEANTRLTGQLSAVTDAMASTKALREAGVTDEVELRHYAGMARQRGLTDETDIREMVETDKAMEKRRHDAAIEAMKESVGDFDALIEGAGGRIPVASLPEDGGVAALRESGLPILETAAAE